MTRSRIHLVALIVTLMVTGMGSVLTKTPLAPGATPANTTSPSISATSTYPVVRVIDGDTIVIRMESKETKVRLIGVNTPETVDPRRPVQCFGKEASAKAKATLPPGTLVRLETDPTQDLYDKYGRLLAYIFLPDETLFNEVMIRDGYAYEYTYSVPYRYQAPFKAAQAAAEKAKAGLWAPGVCGH